MWILILALVGVALFGLVAGYFYNRNIQKKIDRGELKEAPPVVDVDSECCGQHQICEKESLLAAVSKRSNITMTKNWTASKVVRPMNTAMRKLMNSAKSCLP